MPLYVLTETSAGYALLKATDKKLLSQSTNEIAAQTQDASSACSLLKLKKFSKFTSAAEALDQAAAVQDGKVTPMLQKLLDSIKEEKKASLAVADPKLGNAITKIPGLSLKPVADEASQELLRAVREHLPSLISDLAPEDTHKMRLGLSHSMSRHKLRFSTDKIDTMIIQAVKLLDDLDKEINQYAMRVKEWYGWHFPEMAKIINDNTAYARVIIAMGKRDNAQEADLTTALPEEIEKAVKAAAEISMGTEVTDHDMDLITGLAENVVELTDFRKDLAGYLESRMQAIAPNLTALVGELVGARLIAHSGSLINLAKSPASTIQILGAEKALFRALKTRHDTPKYGLLYHASLVGQATGKNKGKIARMLATKTALGLRVDSLSPWGTQGEGADDEEPDMEEKTRIGVEGRLKIERRLRALEGKPLGPRTTSIGPAGQNGASQPAKFEVKEARKYNKDVDGVAANAPARAARDDDNDDDDEEMEDDVEEETHGSAQADKAALKAAKAARKAERAAKREAKAAKKAAKEAKKAGKANGVNGAADSEKKRKRDVVDEDVAGKKKKKSSV